MQLELFSEAKYHPPPDKEKFTEELFEAYYSVGRSFQTPAPRIVTESAEGVKRLRTCSE